MGTACWFGKDAKALSGRALESYGSRDACLVGDNWGKTVTTTGANLDLDKLRDQAKLGRMLLDRGLISQQEHELVCRQTEATGVEMWRLLLNLNLISAEVLNTLVSGTDGVKTPVPTEKPAASAASVQQRTQAETAVRETLHQIVEQALVSMDVPPLVEEIFERAFDARATDIHFDPQDKEELRVRYRIDGQLFDVVTIPPQLAPSVVSRIKILATMDITRRREAQDGHVVQHLGERERNLRIATVPTSRGERLVARILDEQAVLVGLDKLGLDSNQTEAVGRLLRKPYGILIVSGPVGSGKTTTLYSCLNQIHLPTRNVMTIEDPVEYRLMGINQLQVDPRIDWTFPKALRAMLRQDPDVIMVGEIRDDETARIAVRASLTGVLVLSSMHANDAASTVGTLYNFGIPAT